MSEFNIRELNEGFLISKAQGMGYIAEMWAYTTLKEALTSLEKLMTPALVEEESSE